jgi:hypothetical protein
MPYEIIDSIIKGKKGFRVRKSGTREYMSSFAMSYDKALAQMRAILLSELKPKVLYDLRPRRQVKK